jgi:hypothetical protein
VTRRITVPDPHPISEVIGSITFDGVAYEIKRGLLATLDAARARATKGDGVGAWTKAYQRVVIAAVQVAWYETQHKDVPVSCQRTLTKAREAAV